MELKGSRTIEADRETVWAALLDEDVLRDCVPGCTEMSGSPEDGFEATVVQKVGPVKATFRGHVTLDDMERPERLTISGEGKGGAAGFAKGGAKVTLVDQGDKTQLEYDVEAKVGGKLAQLGSRIIDSFAKKMADQFFSDFKDKVEGKDGAADSVPNSGADDAAAPADDAKERKGWFGRKKAAG